MPTIIKSFMEMVLSFNLSRFEIPEDCVTMKEQDLCLCKKIIYEAVFVHN